MPSTIISVPPADVTRVSALKPAAGLRYGNFDGIKWLPPIKSKDPSPEENIWTIQNDQINQTVCQWMEQWRPWQQKTLICSIANRCSVSQLEMLSTTLEPLKQRAPRDYKSKQMSHFSKRAKKQKSTNKTNLKNKMPKKSDSSSQRSLPHNTKKFVGKSETPEVPEAFYGDRLKGVEDKKVKENLVGEHGKLTSVEKNKLDTLHGKEKSVFKKSEVQFITNERGNLVKVAKDQATLNNLSETGNHISVDQYASLLSSSILLSALTDITAVSTHNVGSNTSAMPEPHKKMEGELVNVSDIVSQARQVSKSYSTEHTASSHSVGISKDDSENKLELEATKSACDDKKRKISTPSEGKEPTMGTSLKDSAQFLGCVLEFTSDPQQRSSSSNYRYQTFSTSASTAGYFDRRKTSLLGPRQFVSRQLELDSQVMVRSLPVPLQKFCKNFKWWSPQALSSKPSYQSVSKKNLAVNFNDQLQTVWNWFNQWESPERITFIKELLLVSSHDILNTLINFIQQRLNEMKDINCLPDKLLLYILSFLEPKQIMKASKVCRRWRYLCARDDVWILKCLELGEREGISNMPELIQNANRNALGIDWILAYTQLKEIIPSVRRNWNMKMEDSAKGGISEKLMSDLRIGKGKQKKGQIQLKDVHLNAKVSTVTAETEKSEKSSLMGMEEDNEDLMLSDSQTVTDEGMALPPITSSDGLPRRSKSVKLSVPVDQSHDPLDNHDPEAGFVDDDDDGVVDYDMSAVTETPSGAGRSSTRSQKTKSTFVKRKVSEHSNHIRKDPEENEPILDIRTDLRSSKDILGKLVSKTSLEWKDPDIHDETRISMYAGKLLALKRMRKIEGHLSSVTCLNFDARRLVTCGLDRVIRLWDIRSGRSLNKFLGHNGGVRCVQFDNDIMATGSWDCLIMIWSMRNLNNMAVLQGHGDSVNCLEFNPDVLVRRPNGEDLAAADLLLRMRHQLGFGRPEPGHLRSFLCVTTASFLEETMPCVGDGLGPAVEVCMTSGYFQSGGNHAMSKGWAWSGRRKGPSPRFCGATIYRGTSPRFCGVTIDRGTISEGFVVSPLTEEHLRGFVVSPLTEEHRGPSQHTFSLGPFCPRPPTPKEYNHLSLEGFPNPRRRTELIEWQTGTKTLAFETPLGSVNSLARARRHHLGMTSFSDITSSSISDTDEHRLP
ncbi:hypothetical protein Btru_018681 [Bulinus truncatus]|nr:hypothetical protein Btru_018681 [Bulinus truncatus]